MEVDDLKAWDKMKNTTPLEEMKHTGTAAPVTTEAEVAARVDAILGRMSLAEKIGQLTQIGGASFVPGPKPEDVIRKGGAGSVLWLNDTKQFNALQKIAVEESPSKIPLLFALDVIHGYRTIFPVPLALASSWDPAVAERAQAVAAREARAAGLHWTFGPMLDIARDAALGPHRRGRRRRPLPGCRHGVPPRSAGSRGRLSARPIASWPVPNTSRVTARRTAGATTIRSTCPRASCATSTSRPSRPP